MFKNRLSHKLSLKSLCLNYQNVGQEIPNNKLCKTYQEQKQCFSINQKEEHFMHQLERKQQEKIFQLLENQKINLLNERINLNKQQNIRKVSSTEEQKELGEFISSGAKNLKQSKIQQKEIMSSIIKNLDSTTQKKSNINYKNLNSFQDVCISKVSNNDKIFQQQKKEKQLLNQNSFSSLGTISEESIQKSQSSQFLSPSERNFSSSSLYLQEKEDKIEQDRSEQKARKEQEYAVFLISCLVILALSYLYLLIVT